MSQPTALPGGPRNSVGQVPDTVTTRGGTVLPVVATGRADAATTVVPHPGFAQDHTSWEDVIEQLVEEIDGLADIFSP